MIIETRESKKLPFSPLFCDYLKENGSLEPFFVYPHNYDLLKEKVSSFHYDGNRRESARIIQNFNEKFAPEPAARNHLVQLADENSVAITTGQQASIFGGPLYTIYKTLSVIHLSRLLTRDTGRTVIPVFWLADEDHDFQEISSVTIPSGQSTNTIAYECDSCLRFAAGSINIAPSFESFRNEVYKTLQKTDSTQQLVSILDESYIQGRTLSDSFGFFLARLFSKHGLVFAGSHSKEIKGFVSDIIKTAIDKADEIARVLTTRSSAISGRYHQQVQITDSLLFWHDDIEGRIRLKYDNGRWQTSQEHSFTTDDLRNTLQKEPDRFSPNVFLRPLLQDFLLPNAAYVGGPAEIAYYGQMKDLYDLFGQDMPFVAARLSATLAEPSVAKNLDELPIEFPDYSKRIEEVEQFFLRSLEEPELDANFEKWKNKIGDLNESMLNEIGISDPGLHKHARSISRDYCKSLDKLKMKMVQLVRQREEIQINRMRKIKSSLFPNGRLQEREISAIYFMNKFGLDIWDRMLEEIKSHEGLFTDHLLIKL